MADLLALCPVLYKDYAPPLVSMNGGMHMVLSVGESAQPECMVLFLHGMSIAWAKLYSSF